MTQDDRREEGPEGPKASEGLEKSDDKVGCVNQKTNLRHPPPAPAPPPLPANISRTGAAARQAPSVYEASLRSAPADYLICVPKEYQPPPFEPTFYFVYGTLQDKATLCRILEVADAPDLLPAEVHGYTTLRWGDYPALVDGAPDQVVRGHAFEVTAAEQAARLAHYETAAYEAVPCTIVLRGPSQGRMKLGRTFMYAGDAASLREGRWDRRLWERTMGRGLR